MRNWLSAAIFFLATLAHADDFSSTDSAQLRLLDKVTGRVQDMLVHKNDSMAHGRIRFIMTECRYLSKAPLEQSQAQIQIFDIKNNNTIFNGWMLADSPALSAMDHQRYDLWLISCGRA